jgi:hypothetical protein
MKSELPRIEKEIQATLEVLHAVEWLKCSPDFTEKVLQRVFADHWTTDSAEPQCSLGMPGPPSQAITAHDNSISCPHGSE